MTTTVTPVSSLPLCSLNLLSLARAALAYTRLGLAILPLAPRAKTPLVAGGCYSATTDQRRVTAWWQRWPQANIGIATGKPNGWWVLDVDPRHDGLRSLAALERHARDWGAHIPVSATLRQLTGGGGVHLLFQPPQGNLQPPQGRFAGYEGIDLKKEGGYIVGAPSVHPQGGIYQWQNEAPPAPFPLALLELLVEHRQRQFSRASAPTAEQARRHATHRPGIDREEDPEYWLHLALRHAMPGHRHNYACFLAVQLVTRAHCSLAEAETWMREYVALVCQVPGDPYELEDALACLNWAWDTYAR